jgi:two-component system, cell cycle sensor histidine kinase and response regulator CckA
MGKEVGPRREPFVKAPFERPILKEQPTAVVTYTTAFDETRNRLYISPQIEAMLGFSADEWLADPGLVLKQLHPDDRERVLAEVFQSRDTGRPFCSEYRLLARDGHIVWVRDEAIVMRDEAGRPCFMQGLLLDISEQKRKEEMLQKSESKFRTIFERVAVGIALVSIDGQLVESNPALREMLRYGEEELRNRVFNEFTHPEDAAIDVDLDQELIAGKRDHYQIEKRFIRKDGGVVWCQLNVSLVRGGQEELPFTICMVEDITERKRLETQFFQSQKMETIGRLAGGIAHDFNNLLTVIKGYTQLSLSQLQEGDPCRENIEEIKGAAERAAELTNQLLTFSRRQILDMKVLDLNTIVRGLEKMMGRIIGEDIEMFTVLDDRLGRVKTDPGQIEQVILNLVVNARDAMPAGGKLAIETANVVLDETYARTHIGVTPGSYVMLSVSDTGCGMSPEIKELIFEPFFTTKEEGKGTGLGLSTIYGIVRQSGGNIWVYSEPGRGTTFKIYLPRVEEETGTLPVQDDTDHLPKGNETVLLVEDDSSLRALAARVLRYQGYKVLEATNGHEAIGVARENTQERIHLLLTDVVMPYMGGRELVKRMKTLHSEIRVLFISGYTDHAITYHAGLKPGTPFLQKPFSPTALAKKVREVLDQTNK